MTRKSGVTLIELMVVIAIAAVLYAITMPILLRSKREAQWTDDLARMRNLGHAAAIYVADSDRSVRSCAELIESNSIGPSQCQARLDGTVEGYANIVMRQTQGHRNHDDFIFPRPYKLSFIGMRDGNVRPERLNNSIEGTRGWLVDISMTEEGCPTCDAPWIIEQRKGRYRRLLDSGAVVLRHIPRIVVNTEQGVSNCMAKHWVYADYAQKDLENECKTMVGLVNGH